MEIYGSFSEEKPPGMYVPVTFPSLTVLNQKTRDGRTISGDGFAPLELPRSIKLQTSSQPGHDGAEPAGRIDEIIVEGDNVAGRGWLLDDAIGHRAAYLIKTRALRGNSVDLSVAQEDVDIIVNETDDGMWTFEMKFRNAKVAATTLVTEPAFDNAGAIIPEGWSVDGIPEPESILASVGEFSALHPFEFSVITREPVAPAERFRDPKLTEPTPGYVDEDNVVFGHLATWGTSHINDMQVNPPRSRTNYAHFANKHVLTDEGMVATGPLVLGSNHAPDDYGYQAAVDFYANTSAAWADVAIGEDDIGIWFAGQVRPGTKAETIYAARASAISGDWRFVGAGLDLVAALSVNAAGFPIPRARAYAHANGHQLSLTGAGVLKPRDTMRISNQSFATPELTYLANRMASQEAQEIAAALESIGI